MGATVTLEPVSTRHLMGTEFILARIVAELEDTAFIPGKFPKAFTRFIRVGFALFFLRLSINLFLIERCIPNPI